MRTFPKTFHLALFLATCVSTFGVFFVLFGGGVVGGVTDKIWGSVLYAAVLMLILLAHEMGHFVMARAHGVAASWPYFIPFPLGFGTMGAVIRLQGRIPTRNALVDIGAAGPLAGLLIAVPMLWVGISLSHVEALPLPSGGGEGAFGGEGARHFFPPLSLVNLASMGGLYLRHLTEGTPAPSLPEMEVFGDNLLILLGVRLIHGVLPAGHDLVAHPVFVASWFGLLMTMLNLLPVGQLDGGHLTHAWFGTRAERIGEVFAALALVLALFCSASWLVWFFLITRFIGLRHPPVEDDGPPLSPMRKGVVVITWLMTVLTFMPVPLSLA